MVLKNYWLILAWMLLSSGFCLLTIRKKDYLTKEIKYEWPLSMAILIMLPYAIWAGVRTSSWGDTHAYFGMFSSAPNNFTNIIEYLNAQLKDKGFFLFIVTFKTIIGDYQTAFFILIATIQAGSLIYIYHKYSSDYWLSVFLFTVSGDYMSWMHNGIRQFLAVTILFACTPLLVKKKYLQLIIIILILSTVHQTALLWIPFIFIVQGKAWNKKTILFIIAVIIGVVFLDHFTDIFNTAVENSQYGYELEDMQQTKGTGLLRVLFYSVPAMISLLFIRRIRSYGGNLINICANMSVATAGFYVISYFTSGIYIGRIPIYFSLYNYLLYPWIIHNVFTKESGLFLKIGLIGTYCVFFYYQMHMAWGLI